MSAPLCSHTHAPGLIRRIGQEEELGAVLDIINEAALAYRGKIPADCWHEPYMSLDELKGQLEAGVIFVGCEVDGTLAGVMGIQSVLNVELIRHAYVLPRHQGIGVGTALIGALRARAARHLLVGTWAAAAWAIGFYKRHGFRLVPEPAAASVLRTYWRISARQVETSVVLATPELDQDGASKLMETAGRLIHGPDVEAGPGNR